MTLLGKTAGPIRAEQGEGQYALARSEPVASLAAAHESAWGSERAQLQPSQARALALSWPPA